MNITQKQASMPEENLKTYFAKGQKCKFRRLTSNQIKRLFFNWLKDDSDVRTFDEVFNAKVEYHEEQWKKQYDLKTVKFVPKTLGSVTLDYNQKDRVAKLTFISERHQPLVVMKPINTHKRLLKWVRDKVNDYCNENTVEINKDNLKANLVASIETTILLF